MIFSMIVYFVFIVAIIPLAVWKAKFPLIKEQSGLNSR